MKASHEKIYMILILFKFRFRFQDVSTALLQVPSVTAEVSACSCAHDYDVYNYL